MTWEGTWEINLMVFFFESKCSEMGCRDSGSNPNYMKLSALKKGGGPNTKNIKTWSENPSNRSFRASVFLFKVPIYGPATIAIA